MHRRRPIAEPVPLFMAPRDDAAGRAPGALQAPCAPRAARPALRPVPSTAERLAPLNEIRGRALVVDLNNFSVFPTLAIGILVAALRNAGYEAEVLSPLAHDVVAAERERRETPLDQIVRRVHLSTFAPFRHARDAARAARRWWISRPNRRVLKETARALDARPDVVMLSAYLQHYPMVREIGALAEARGIPVLLGGPVFNMDGIAEAWRGIPALKAIVGGEVDLILPEIVDAVRKDEDLLRFDGVVLPDGRRSRPAPPLRRLDDVPVPDFTDFPWDRYPNRVIPMMTGRGCQWARCAFCSDVVSASGRTYRTRSVGSVMDEMREQARRHQTTNFLFLDIKLNSNPGMFRGIIENVQHHVPGAQWIGTVHVDQRDDNGLDARTLRAAAAAGLRRVSFGLESGSQRMLDAMDKGCTVDANSAFIRNAHAAGISVRCTMFKGFPGETAEDLNATADFLEAHTPFIDRIRYNDFSVHEDTPVHHTLTTRPETYPGMRVARHDARNGRLIVVNEDSGSRRYRRAKARVLRAVHRINRRPLRTSARAFDGLM